MTKDERFSEARHRVLSLDSRGEGIGRLSEKSQHQILKYYIEPNDSFHEIKHLGSYADIKNEHGIYEIQTRGTERLIPKLKKFLPDSVVTLVLPLAKEKSISWVDTETGSISEPKRSPKKEGIFDALLELSKISEFVSHENFRLKLVFLYVSEYRYLNGYDKSRKHGSTRLERIPNRVLDEIDISSPYELLRIISEDFPEEFTMEDFRKITKRTPRRNFYIMRFLEKLGFVERAGKRGRAYLYRKIK